MIQSFLQGPEEPLHTSVHPRLARIAELLPNAKANHRGAKQPGTELAGIVGADDLRFAEPFDGVEHNA